MSLRNDLRTYFMDIRSSGQFNSALAKLLKSTTGGATDFREPGKAPSTQQGNSIHQYKVYISFISNIELGYTLYFYYTANHNLVLKQLIARDKEALSMKKSYSHIVHKHQQLRKDYQKLIGKVQVE